MKWLVTSINAQKLLGVKQALDQVFSDDSIELKGQNIPNSMSLPPQPVGYNAGVKYASKRIAKLDREMLDWCDYIVSVESYVENEDVTMYDAMAVVIATKDQKIVAQSQWQCVSRYTTLVLEKYFEKAVKRGWATTDALKCTIGGMIHEEHPEIPANNWMTAFGGKVRNDQIAHVVKKTLRYWQSKQELISNLREYPDFPKPGVLFQDMNPLLANPQLFEKLIDLFVYNIRADKIDLVLGLESRGFILGVAVAMKIGKGFVPARKPGKLPGKTIAASYQKEYGTDSLEVQLDRIPANSRVLIIDDILATGGTADAACKLVEQAGAKVISVMVVNDVPFLRPTVARENTIVLLSA